MKQVFSKIANSTVSCCLRLRWIVIACVVLLTLISLGLASRLVFDSSVESWFVEGDPTMKSYNEFRARFGQDEMLIVGLFTSDVYSPEFLRSLSQFTQAVEKTRFVRSAVSLANLRTLQATDGGGAKMEPIMPTVPNSIEEAAQLRQRVQQSGALSGGLVAQDARATAVVITLTNDCIGVENQSELIESVKALGNSLTAQTSLRVAGTPVVNVGMFHYAQRDMRTLTPLALALVFVTTWLMYRRLSAAIVPVIVVTIAVAWVFGLMSVFGMKLNILHAALILVLIVCGVVNSIHILAAYFRELEAGRSGDEAVTLAISEVLQASLFAVVTTVVGFLSLVTTQLQPIREYGLMAALGALFAFGLSTLFVPPILCFVRPPARRLERAGESYSMRFVKRVSQPSFASSIAVFAVTSLIAAGCVWQMTRLTATANPMNYFRSGDPLRKDIEAIDEVLSGSTSIEFLLKSPNFGLIDSEKLNRLEVLQNSLEQLPAVERVISIVDVLKEYRRVTDPENPEGLPHPRRIGVVARRMLDAAPEQMNALVQDDFSVGRMTARIRLAEADQLTKEVPAMSKRLEAEFGAGSDLHVEGTGFIKLVSTMQDYLVQSQIKSLPTAALTISVMMMILLRSWKLGLLAMVPNLFPISIGLALMAILGINLDPGTAMTATVAIGLVVDDTAHFLVYLRDHSNHAHTLEERISETTIATGPPIIATTLILALGFLALTLGSFNPTVYFGAITAVVIVVALLCDLIITPAILIVFRPKL